MRRACGGWTLVELLVALTIFLILAGLAAPTLGPLSKRWQLRSAANDLFGAFGLVRAAAIARGQTVLLVPSDGSRWEQGWTVFVDANDNLRPDPDEEVIEVHGKIDGAIRVGSTFPATHAVPYVAYNGAGRSCSASNSLAAHFGTLSLASGDEIRRIKVNMLGRARLCNPAVDVNDCDGSAP